MLPSVLGGTHFVVAPYGGDVGGGRIGTLLHKALLKTRKSLLLQFVVLGGVRCTGADHLDGEKRCSGTCPPVNGRASTYMVVNGRGAYYGGPQRENIGCERHGGPLDGQIGGCLVGR